MSRRRGLVGNKAKFKDYCYINDDTYYDYLERLKKVAMSIFEWTNLPDSMDSRYIEYCLYYSGQASLLKDDNGNLINMRACSAGELNIYEMPTQINCYSVGTSTTKINYDGYVPETKRPEDYCVYVMNNLNHLPTAPTLELFAYRLYLAQRTADVNISSCKTPYVVGVPENQRLTMENVLTQIDENKPAIIGTKDLIKSIDESIKILPTNVNYIADKLNEYKVQIWNEALSFLGINNLSEKKERLISDEANSNNELINLNLQSYLAPRKRACELFNKLFGLSGDKAIDVKVRSDLLNVIKREDSIVSDLNGDGIIEEDEVVNE